MNIPDSAYTVSVFTLSLVSFILSCCFLSIRIPKIVSLQNYRTSRRILAVAYFVVGALSITKLICITNQEAKDYTYIFTLIIASVQALLFTSTLIVLVNIRFITRKKIYRHLLPILIFSVLLIGSYLTAIRPLYKVIYNLFTLYYLFQLVYYSRLLHIQFQLYKDQFNNYFSGHGQMYLQWIRTGYILCLISGVAVLFCILLAHKQSSYLNVFLIFFFFYFGINYINYVFAFHFIQPIVDPETQTDAQDAARAKIYTRSDMKEAINQWAEKKEFLNKTLSIEEVARALQTNRTYLSKYINSEMQINFKTWINDLRIEEAKYLIQNCPELSIGEIGTLAGFIEKSNFSRQFQKSTGITPYLFRKSIQQK